MASCSKGALLSATKLLHSPQNAHHLANAALGLKIAIQAGPSSVRRAATVAGPNKPDAKGPKDRPVDDRKGITGDLKPSQRRYALLRRPDVTTGHERPSQRPYGVAMQVEKVLKTGQLEDAIKMVSSAPISSQNAVVWTLLVKQAFADGLPNRAFKLFSDVSGLLYKTMYNLNSIHIDEKARLPTYLANLRHYLLGVQPIIGL